MNTRISILIVDDHALFRRGLESLLSQNDIVDKIFHAGSRDEVMQVIGCNLIDLIFMDIRMNGTDGISITREVINLYPRAKIIALSMLDDKASILRMFKAGAIGYLTKSSDSREILAAVDTVLNGNKFIASELPSDLLDESFRVRKNESDDVCCNFTRRELEVLKLTTQGYSNKETAKTIGVSVKAIEAVKSRLFDKTNARNSAGLVKFAFDNGIVNKF